MKIALVRPNITFFSLPKMLTMGLFVSFILSALAWFWLELLGYKHSKMIGVFAGAIWFLLACWNWWVWRPRQKNTRWHRWLSGLIYVLYVGSYLWLGGVIFWGGMLVTPWNLVAVGILFILFIVVLTLPVANQEMSKKLYKLHGSIDRKVIIYGGILIGGAGVIGYWLQETLEKDFSMIFVAILSPIIALGMIQHQIFEVWQTRPWIEEK